MEIKLIVLIVLNVVYVVHGVIPSDCTQGVNCILPGCFCATFDHPNRTAKFPQIVYFAIDDALTVTVENYSQRGHEIGCHGVNHTNVDTASNSASKPDCRRRTSSPKVTSPEISPAIPGFWEVPVFSLRNPETGYECAYVDSCRPSSEAAALNYLWSNFLQVFNDNRAPFGLNMHGAWFLYSDDYLNAADTFIKKLLEMDDVYIVSVEKSLDWMRNPVEISDIQEKLPSWGCQNPTQATAVQ
ncbi:hypothetical protein C0Q70_19810 [Pomacea canaliculata]|uniref:NodB homology domain-containing protein n=1 Tax=Pomacea canaliculata TaxID=400727 RepID=A0A2T7NDS5_POMCA|nr:hypothetical protein C0Q70_19810 [Pomacea canaliculata]